MTTGHQMALLVHAETTDTHTVDFVARRQLDTSASATGLYLGMALGPTRRPVLPGMKQALAAPWNMEHRLPKFNQLEMVTTFTYKPSLVKIDAHNFDSSW